MIERMTVFISGVSNEFSHYREQVAKALLSRGVFPNNQDIFPTDYRAVEGMLISRIKESDAVICLVGFEYGTEPEHQPDDRHLSYSQREYEIARAQGKPVYVFLASESTYKPEDPPPELEREFGLQALFRKSLEDNDNIYYKFESERQLIEQVLKIPVIENAKPNIAATRLPTGKSEFIDRDGEREMLSRFWEDDSANVVSIVSWGGVGKTALVSRWLADMAKKKYGDAVNVFDWSFHSQGAGQDGLCTTDDFIDSALRFFGDHGLAGTNASPWDKGARLADLAGYSRTLLVLDGVEPLQHPPGPEAGQFKDPSLKALLTKLAQWNKGLCLVTTREPVTDLGTFNETTLQEVQLEHLEDDVGAALLRTIGVVGGEDELRQASREVHGHALTLNLLGKYLVLAHNRDISKRDQVRFVEADSELQGGYAFKVLEAYETWMRERDEAGERLIAVMRLMGLFNCPAPLDCLNALRTPPVIEGINELLVDIGDKDWNIALRTLEERRLLILSKIYTDIPGPPDFIDAHPLIREYNARKLRDQGGTAWREAHHRLYDHLAGRSVPTPSTVDDLQPLIQTVMHGCQSGRHEETFNDIYWKRVVGGAVSHHNRPVGASSGMLGVLREFYDRPWTRTVEGLEPETRLRVIGEAGIYLFVLGHLRDGADVLSTYIDELKGIGNWVGAARSARLAREAHLLMGDFRRASALAEKGVEYSDRDASDDGRNEQLVARAALAQVLHLQGKADEALACFEEALRLEREIWGPYFELFGYSGFWFCEFLLDQGDLERARTTAEFMHAQAEESGWALEQALSKLILGVLHCRESAVRGRPLPEKALNLLTEAEAVITYTGQQHHLVNTLLTRGNLFREFGHCEAALRDLDRAGTIARSRGMIQYLAEYHEAMAWLLLVHDGPDETMPDGISRAPLHHLQAAREQAVRMGYARLVERLDAIPDSG